MSERRGIASFKGTVFELMVALRREMRVAALLQKYDVTRPPDHDPLLEDEHPGADPFDTQGPYFEMNLDTFNELLARAPLWRLRRGG